MNPSPSKSLFALAPLHLCDLGMILVLVILVDMAIAGARSGIDGSFALLEAARWYLRGVCAGSSTSVLCFAHFIEIDKEEGNR